MPASDPIRAATRGSALARWQTDHVAALVAAASSRHVEPVIVSTVGDRDKSTPIHEIGGKGVFVKEVQAALLDGRADIAVHSAKDLPAITPTELVIAAVPPRADVRDALVGARFDDLAPGSRVGTGSVRRRVQLLAVRPDLVVEELRGNIDTRLSRLDDLDAIVMAAAALDRLGREPAVVERLDPRLMIPQVGQGTLAIECRADDHSTRQVLAAIDDPSSRRLLDAERAFLAELGGDCDLPAGCSGRLADGKVELRAFLSDGDPASIVSMVAIDADGISLGTRLARDLRSALES
ncbi:MAG: hydroxymethylbilane synthase [Acidimicrobiales bacterium]